MLKEDKALVTIQIRGDGPAGGLTVTADSHFHAKGYVNNPHVQIPLKPNGKLDVSGAIGKGTLTVIRDIGLKEPYVVTIQMPSAEIAEDLTLYFAESEQIPSSVGLGVLVDRDWSVRQAGGFILQLMPGHYEYLVDELEANLAGINSVTSLMEDGMGPTEILQYLLRGMDYQELDAKPVRFHCGCNEERASRVMLALGAEELQSMM
jgi:molecular chaperone Hsp33